MKIIIIAVSSFIVLLGLSACSLFGDPPDRVTQGSLTLTPLEYPEDLQVPKQDRSALQIPETIDPKDMQVVDSDPAPPELDIEKANAEVKLLQPPESKQQKKARLLLSSEVKQTPDGNQFLLVSSDFDRLWEGMGDIAVELGFTVDDLNRSKQSYYVHRDIKKTAQQELEEQDTGVKRELGNRESYQIFLDAQDANHTWVKIRNDSGQDDDSGLARLLLVQIKSVLEQPIK